MKRNDLQDQNLTQHDELTQAIIGAAFTVHNTLGGGFLESVYEKSLQLELDEIGISNQFQIPVPVYYRGQQVGDFIADVLTDGKVLCELKAVEALKTVHEVQLVNYLQATGLDIGLLINFGPTRVDIKRKYRLPKVQ
jgi:GxxExxY protein